MAYRPYPPQSAVCLVAVLAACLVLAAPPALAQVVGPPSPPPKAEGPKSMGDAAAQMKNSMLRIFKPQPATPDAEAADTSAGQAAKAGNAATSGRVPVNTAGISGLQSNNKMPAEAPVDHQGPKHPPLMQAPALSADIETPEVSHENPPMAHPTLDDPNNPLGITASQKQLDAIDRLIDNKQYISARSQLAPLKQWLIDATEIHIDLYKTLSKLSSARTQAEFEKQVALKFGMLRDEALFLQGRILVGENQLKDATKMLTEVIKSQPRSDIGVQAYGMLQQIGFTEKIQLAQ
jgi:hypothetical protein